MKKIVLLGAAVAIWRLRRSNAAHRLASGAYRCGTQLNEQFGYGFGGMTQ